MAAVCLTEASTEYGDAECCCKLEKVVVLKGFQESIEPAIPQLVGWVIGEPVEGAVPMPAEQDVHASLPCTGEDIPVLKPVVADKPIPGPPITEEELVVGDMNEQVGFA